MGEQLWVETAGDYRSPYFSHAKRALYHLSYPRVPGSIPVAEHFCGFVAARSHNYLNSSLMGEQLTKVNNGWEPSRVSIPYFLEVPVLMSALPSDFVFRLHPRLYNAHCGLSIIIAIGVEPGILTMEDCSLCDPKRFENTFANLPHSKTYHFKKVQTKDPKRGEIGGKKVATEDFKFLPWCEVGGGNCDLQKWLGAPEKHMSARIALLDQ
ncbi:hypothetical protein OUZ56_025805 [Daphnia magna]|uniref:Uncharacterized protein n=1 Tax=Daphnia magna TaxID=35525 RepID=A0ABQ9ZKB5_9CRUS|nr:hypothetical protein OUZ56_025805 [Daphnia magna]